MKAIGKENQNSQNPCVDAIPRFCYRKKFSKIAGTNITSDSGWGCCFRSAQGLLAQFMINFACDFPEIFDKKFGRINPLTLFLDTPHSTFGIHRLSLAAQAYGLNPGSWAKTSIVAESIASILNFYQIHCIIARDFKITEMDIANPDFPALFLIPCLFGLGKFDLTYVPFLQMILDMEGSLGFVCGKQGAAYYMVGYTESQFSYFDPHVTKMAVTDESDMSSFFSLPIKFIDYKSINPSLLLGFICSTPEDLQRIVTLLTTTCPSPITYLSSDQVQSANNDVRDLDELV